MSRHSIAVRPGGPATEAAVGWDRPLKTFFVQVFGPKVDDEDQVILWLGTEIGEIATATEAVSKLEPYCEIPPDLYATLELDRMKTLGSTDGPAQIDAKRFIGKNQKRGRG